jgi:hypothetical protein
MSDPSLLPPARAGLIWARALERAGPFNRHELLATVLDLLRAAHHDPADLSHALALGHNDRRARPDDSTVRAGLALLEETLAFLGVKPHRRYGCMAR